MNCNYSFESATAKWTKIIFLENVSLIAFPCLFKTLLANIFCNIKIHK